MDQLTLKTSLLTRGLDLPPGRFGGGRRGGAGPAGLCIETGGFLVNVPASRDLVNAVPLKTRQNGGLKAVFEGEEFPVKEIPRPKFYEQVTSDGIPMKKIALLHGRDCLATTVYQRCRLVDSGMGCGFCAIETSLKSGATVLRKTATQLLEVAQASMGDGITHFTLTSGAPNLREHGARMLAEIVRALKENFSLPVHVQISTPTLDSLELLHKSGSDTVGIHIETFDKGVVERVCPGKKDFDFAGAFRQSVDLFGEGQVSSFVLGGLGEEQEVTKRGFEKLAELGVIPFLVPFRPLPGSRMQSHPAPDPLYMRGLYVELAQVMKGYGVKISGNRAGCVRCGACSAIDVAMKEV
jgi:radical SAM protein (TIGR04043 family)